MKKFNYLLLMMLGLVLATLNVSAQSSVNTWLINSNVVTNLVVSGPITIRTVTVTANGTQPAFYFYDYNTNGSIPLGSLQYSNTTSFSNLVTIDRFTNSTIFTNSLGQSRTNQYVGQYSYWTNVATATLSNAQQIGSLAIQSGVPYSVAVNWVITKGITVRGTNNANAAIILEYQ